MPTLITRCERRATRTAPSRRLVTAIHPAATAHGPSCQLGPVPTRVSLSRARVASVCNGASSFVPAAANCDGPAAEPVPANVQAASTDRR